jgi:replicative DNA helicase
LKEAREAGVHDDLLTGAAKRAWGFVCKYTSDHGVMPPMTLVKENTGFEASPVDDGVTIRYVADKLFDRKQFYVVQEHLTETSQLLDRGDQEGAVGRCLEDADRLKGLRAAGLRVHTLADTARDVQESYRAIAGGARGVEMPWESINRINLGLHPGTLTFLVARPSIGKTWMCVICASYAWAHGGKRVLVVSPEMDRVELCERVIAYHGQFNYSAMISGTLGAFAEPKFDAEIERLSDPVKSFSDRFFILDDEGMMSPDAIEAAGDAVDPDLVCVDSTYMLKATENGKYFRGQDKKERVDAVAEWLRSYARRKRIPVMAISQLSRDAKKIKRKSQKKIKEGISTGGLEDTLAFTDVIFQHSHNVFALMRDEDMLLNRQMAIVVLKVRRPVTMTRTVMINWDLENMNFAEIGAEAGEQFEDHGYEDVEPF